MLTAIQTLSRLMRDLTAARPMPEDVVPEGSSVESSPASLDPEFFDLRYKRFLNAGNGIQFTPEVAPGMGRLVLFLISSGTHFFRRNNWETA